jgi:uncharacterized FAD-dependent dehydrogenase
MNTHYDTAIIGGGISGLMCAYRMLEKDPERRIIILEKGAELRKRSCPLVAGKADKCLKCRGCAIMEGVAGAGAFSDGKYIISTEYGGWLPDFISPETVMKYIEQADGILVSFGATTERFKPDDSLRLLCLQHDLHMQQALVKHLGTDDNFSTMLKMSDSIAASCKMLTRAAVTDVDARTHEIKFTKDSEEHVISCRRDCFRGGPRRQRLFLRLVPAAIQRAGHQQSGRRRESAWSCQRRCGTNFSKKIYEPKIWYRSRIYGDT